MIPFLDLSRVNAPHMARIEAAMQAVARSGWYVLGSAVQTFEEAFAAYVGVKHCIGVANGLEALTLTLKAWNLPPGSEVITQANAYVASVLAISQAGLTPVLVDPDPATYLLDADRVAAAITPRTRVILPVHLYGRCTPMAPLRALADQHKLLILEDAAQAHGATQQGQRAGSLGHAAGFSFYPTKNLGALGDAGAITTNDDQLAAQLRQWRNYGSSQKYINEVPGHNSRLDEIQAAVLSAKLPFLDAENDHRRALARRYLAELQCDDLVLPPANTIDDDAWHLFVVCHPRRDDFRAYLHQHGVGTELHYPIPPYRQPVYASQWSPADFPVTETLCRKITTLPLSTYMTDSEISVITYVINNYR
ncbi:DegT/DnrJ/EryC1/StrS family aminotransferase [Fibrella sp. HMF5335]|uniref:DegT/DnrJ/EryC1/StrS family aminotransferase n=1 Tax=Fibrella rubiginis TaxID=2817060 RepID=A0A939GEF3_9BACT|nr:DegT/DnrJ/EryC1/StrS family aminotransferase [Fibrella rubiginis]MBO0935211.1 DegT/DnrJ/EryC1/StrS family aminotransferase [Fibrella rubiginis]